MGCVEPSEYDRDTLVGVGGDMVGVDHGSIQVDHRTATHNGLHPVPEASGLKGLQRRLELQGSQL